MLCTAYLCLRKQYKLKMDNSKKTFLDTSRAMFFFLLKRRWYYFVLAFILAGAYFCLRRETVASPTREYVTTYKIKYANSGEYEVITPNKRLHWEMQNPYSLKLAKKYFESTKLVVDAGADINYTVEYRHKGVDIYPNRPVEVRFLDPQIKQFDAWTMTLELDSLGVLVKNLKGIYLGNKISSCESFRLPYDVASESPLGAMLVKKLNLDKNIKQIKVRKISELAAQDKYDASMKRYTGGDNLIEMFLTADCTPEFAYDLFQAIGRTYTQYAHDYYVSELQTYLARLSKAKEELKSGQFSLADSLIQFPKLKAQSLEKTLAHLEDLEADAAANALVLSQENMVEILDDNYIRSSKQFINPRAYLLYIALLIFALLPFLLLLLECFLRDWVLTSSTLPEAWLNNKKIVEYDGKGNELERYVLSRYLKEQLQTSKEQTLIIGELKPTELKEFLLSQASNFDLIIASDYADVQSQLAELQARKEYLIILTSAVEGLKLQEQMKGSLALALKPFAVSHGELEQLSETCLHLSLEPMVFWSKNI